MKIDIRLDLVREIFQDADAFSFIANECYVDIYDGVADIVNSKIDKDHTIEQLQKIIWDGFYQDLCIGEIGGGKDIWALDKGQARYILGEPIRFKGIALNLRDKIFKL